MMSVSITTPTGSGAPEVVRIERTLDWVHAFFYKKVSYSPSTRDFLVNGRLSYIMY